MGERIDYQLADGVATVTMDDGKVNALSPAMLDELFEVLDKAESDEAVVILTGRETTFTGGFDLKTFQAGDMDAVRSMLAGGARLTERLLSFPGPVVAACNGNAIAMGSFMLLGCDVRIGAEGDYKLGLNETQLGMTIPWYAIEAARHRLAPSWFDRCTVTGLFIGPEEAREAGFLDELVPIDQVADKSLESARYLAGVKRPALVANKLRVREHVLERVRDGIKRIEDEEFAEW
ncbi:crotonase/enoyl-CoA hydratase family protein [soil metagenome]